MLTAARCRNYRYRYHAEYATTGCDDAPDCCIARDSCLRWHVQTLVHLRQLRVLRAEIRYRYCEPTL